MNDSSTTITPELIAELRERYTPPTIPPCRVCGGKLSIAQVGGGQPTVWACRGKEDDPDRPGWLRDAPGRWTNAPNGAASEFRADGHYNRSRWTDYRQGGDSDVIAVLDALEAALVEDLLAYVEMKLESDKVELPPSVSKEGDPFDSWFAEHYPDVNKLGKDDPMAAGFRHAMRGSFKSK